MKGARRYAVMPPLEPGDYCQDCWGKWHGCTPSGLLCNLGNHTAIETAWLFEDPEIAERFRAVGRSWIGTPFAEHSRAKGEGGGIDCVGFCEEWFLEAEAGPRFHFSRSDTDYKGHCHNTKILEYLRGTHPDPQSKILGSLFAELTNLDELVPIASWPHRPVRNTQLLTGDLCIIKSKIPGVWHLPVMLDDRMFLHCAHPLGVTEGDITQADYRSRLKAVFRMRAQPLAA